MYKVFTNEIDKFWDFVSDLYIYISAKFINVNFIGI